MIFHSLWYKILRNMEMNVYDSTTTVNFKVIDIANIEYNQLFFYLPTYFFATVKKLSLPVIRIENHIRN